MESNWGAAAPVVLVLDLVLAAAEAGISGLLEGSRRRRGFSGRAGAGAGAGAGAKAGAGVRESGEEADGELEDGSGPAEEVGSISNGKRRSGWSEARGWEGGLLARSIDAICPVPWLFLGEPGEQTYRGDFKAAGRKRRSFRCLALSIGMEVEEVEVERGMMVDQAMCSGVSSVQGSPWVVRGRE